MSNHNHCRYNCGATDCTATKTRYKPQIKIVGPGIMTVESEELLKSEKIRKYYRMLRDPRVLKELFRR